MNGFEWPWLSRTRPMLQSEAAECGLTCVAMIAAHFGHRVNVGGLRRQFPTSMKGATLTQLISVASQLELAPRALRLELDEIADLKLPAILHWDLNHFVVLEKVSGKTATILDPASGRIAYSIESLGRHFTGVALELTPTAEFKPVDSLIRIRINDLWGKMLNYSGAMAQVLVLSLLLQVTALCLPFFMQLTIDEAIGQSNANLLALLVVGFVFVHLFSIVLRSLRAWVVLALGHSISFQLGGNVVRHLLRLPMQYFESRHVGDLMSRLRSVAPIQAILTQGIVNAVIDALLAVTTLVVMALIDMRLMMIVVVATLIYMIFRILIYPAIRRRTEDEIVAEAREDTYLMESMRAMRAIKLHAHETVRESGWRNRYVEIVNANYWASMYRIWTRLVESILSNGQLLLVVYIAALDVIADKMTIGMMLAFLSYRSSFMDSATALFDHAERWRLLSVHLERLSDIVAEKKEDILPAQLRLEAPAPPSIIIEDLSFSYSPDDAPVLSNLSITIPAGSFVAIIGESGAGKTTLMRIMLGLLNPVGGRLLIDGQPLGPGNLSSWRARIGSVLQDDQLLSGTIADNISFFDDAASHEKIVAAAKLAHIDDTITAMPMGYQSLIGDMGAALSSGQRQRIILARALFRYPDVLFLDEGTANLDEGTERAIADVVKWLPFTRIIISHRPLLVERADMVFRLTGGRLELISDRRKLAA